MHSAVAAHGKDIGVQLNTPGRVKSDLTAYREADSAFKAARAKRLEGLSVSQREIDAQARRFILQTKHVLKDQFGGQWNLGWSEAGFAGDSLRVPRTIDQREALVERLAAYLAAHADLEVEKLGVTAKAAFELHERFVQVRSELRNNFAEERRLSEKRLAKLGALRKRLRGLTNELAQLLEGDDERWLAFGMTPPAVIKARRQASRRAQAAQDSASASQQPGGSLRFAESGKTAAAA